jgi:hypothetical protein
MKQLLFLALTWALSFSFSACNNDKEGDSKKNADSPLVKASEAPAAFIPYKALMVQHTVKDYAKWKAAYLAHDSMRAAYGITHFRLARGMEADSNSILVFDKMNDEVKAKAFAKAPGLKAAMKAAGVSGIPVFNYLNVVRSDTSAITQTERVMIMHKVKDYDTWLKVFDKEGKDARVANGMVDRILARSIDDPNMVCLIFAITDMGKAKARASSDELKKLMQEAGVEGAPKVTWMKVDQ